MIRDLINITKQEIEESAQKSVNDDSYITDNGDYYANKLHEINVGTTSCEAIDNDKTFLSEAVYRSGKTNIVKFKRKTK